MARGWESKAVEEQIDSHRVESKISSEQQLSRFEIAKKSKRESMQLARARTTTALQSTQDTRYRALLQRTLEFLDSELAKLG